MVTLGVSSANMGLPPDPENPAPHYPCVPFRKFNAVQALDVYRENLNKERKISAAQAQLHLEKPGPIRHQRILMERMPGEGSLDEIYNHMGFSIEPTTKRRIAPILKDPPVLDGDDLLSTPSVSSRASSALTRSSKSRSLRKSASTPDAKSHFAPAQGGVCCLSQRDKENLQKEKNLILKRVGGGSMFHLI
eukprot:TRINITY_DN91228_c0_g1_i1.p1 TRINITY_DN91228_c0_g1~~TRINITY_DN91228_c0_g1_i1.p1  ORF type:complete len:191 (+),score=10.41 TRINITY_DN91228_c0_g1_i1:54-626(+)